MTEPMTQEAHILANLLEQQYEHHLSEAYVAERCRQYAGDHYTYRDLAHARHIAGDLAKEQHLGLLGYVESESRMTAIQKRVWDTHLKLLEEKRIV